MPGKHPKTVNQLIHAYAFQRIQNLVDAKRRLGGNPMLDELQIFFPHADRSTLRSVIDEYKQARDASRKGKPSQFASQLPQIPVYKRKGKRFEYTVKVKVNLTGSGADETWFVPVRSSNQLSHSDIDELVREKVEYWEQNAIGRSKEKIRPGLTTVSVEPIFVTRTR